MKKMLCIASLILAITSQSYANEMITVNNTNQASTVKLLTGMFAGYCATEIPFGSDAYTPKHSTKHFSWKTISVICSHAFPCQAELFVGDSISCQESFGDVSLGVATLNEDGTIEVNTVHENDKYSFSISGDTLYLHEK